LETVENMLKFIGSYPAWAKSVVLLALIAVVITLVFSPRAGTTQLTEEADPQPLALSRAEQRVYLKIKAIRLYPNNPEAQVQLSIFVNETEYIHPSVAGVKWMKVGPSMSEKIVELPKAERYNIRFELRIRNGSTLRQQIQASQQVTPVKTLPYAEEYTLYPVSSGIRAAAVSAVIPYEVYAQ
jgi:hypothetical protein